MKISKRTTVEASAERAWEILGPNYARAGDWASAVYVSGARSGPAKVAGAPVAGRTCETSLGPFTESIEAYDEGRRHIAYSATGAKMPGFVRSLVNAWWIEPAGPERCTVTMEMTADIAQPFRTLMGWAMRRQFDTVLTESMDDFKVYVETGRPSARKVKADASKKGRTARRAATA